MVKRILIFLFLATNTHAQMSDWIMQHPDMVKESPWWNTTVSAPKFLWLKWGEVEIKYPPEISSISGPGCSFDDLDSPIPYDLRKSFSQTRAILHVLRGHRIMVKCRGYMLKSQAELVAEFPLNPAKKWCHEAPCIESIHLNGP